MTVSPSPNVAPLAVTIGDPGGIGPEVALRALLAVPGLSACLVGPGSLWRAHAAMLARHAPELDGPLAALLERAVIVETADPEPGAPPRWGATNARHGAVARNAVEEAAARCMDGRCRAMVTAPLSKEGLRAAGGDAAFPGHTELLQHLTGAGDVGMLLVGGGLRVALVTIHVPLRDVFALLEPGLVARKALLLHRFLVHAGFDRPRIGLAGLNPHAGEGGLFGDEEERVLVPAIALAAGRGVELIGPRPPDTVFAESLAGHYDAVLALYHDQGLIAVKTLAFDTGVNVTLGLPVIRTSPDHGTAFGIAGRGEARAGSMRAAVEMAVDLASRRAGVGGDG